MTSDQWKMLGRQKRRRLVALLVLMTLVGVAEQLFVESVVIDQLLGGVTALLGIVLVVQWTHLDARQREYRIQWALRLLIIFLAVVGVPLYLILSRDLRRGAVGCLCAFAFSALLLLAEQAAIELTFYLTVDDAEDLTS